MVRSSKWVSELVHQHRPVSTHCRTTDREHALIARRLVFAATFVFATLHVVRTRGIILAAVGNGSLNDELEHAAAAAASKGVAIVRCTRVPNGGVQHREGAAGSANALISASMLPPPKARILLMLALAAGIADTQTLQELFAGV